ncbi:MAG: hypothetical protein A2X94_14580 [Bdellovibrionales bacterium GWB1_55_8]|nr:MAG: hypothetical protein A2X94_14580 [Bdellovibrionales bacterium GWB1_55_8]
MPHTCSINVRGYELDSFGHVNHAVYLNYLEHARWQLLNEGGITLAHLAEWKRWPVIAQIEANYLKPAFMGEELVVETAPLDTSRASFTLLQTIVRDGVPIFRAKIRAVTVNEKGRPAEMPEAFMQLWGTK